MEGLYKKDYYKKLEAQLSKIHEEKETLRKKYEAEIAQLKHENIQLKTQVFSSERSEIDRERLILEVEQHPCLYDVKNQDFKNKELKRNIWKTITMNLVGEQWEEMDNKDEIGNEIQKRWKSIKDSYFKYIKNEGGKSGDANEPKTPYLYHKLSFLQSATSGNMTEETQNRPDPVQSVVGTMEDYQEATCSKEPTLPAVTQMRKKRKTDNFEREIINIQKSNVQPTGTQFYDPDEMFLLSQLPVIKAMSIPQKMDFQIKFIQLLQSCNQPNISQA